MAGGSEVVNDEALKDWRPIGPLTNLAEKGQRMAGSILHSALRYVAVF